MSLFGKQNWHCLNCGQHIYAQSGWGWWPTCGRDCFNEYKMKDPNIRIAELEAELKEARKDSLRLDHMEKNEEGGALLSDDFGNWTVSGEGMQNIPDNPGEPSDIQTTFFVEAANWKPSVREAIDDAIAQSHPSENSASEDQNLAGGEI